MSNNIFVRHNFKCMYKKMEKHNLVIIGVGPAGLSAAIYARRAGIETLILE